MPQITMLHNNMTVDQIARMVESNSAVSVKRVTFRGDLADVVYDEREPHAIAKDDDPLFDAILKAFDALGDIDKQNEIASRIKERAIRRFDYDE